MKKTKPSVKSPDRNPNSTPIRQLESLLVCRHYDLNLLQNISGILHPQSKPPRGDTILKSPLIQHPTAELLSSRYISFIPKYLVSYIQRPEQLARLSGTSSGIPNLLYAKGAASSRMHGAVAGQT